jgi:anti-repressor protein
LKILNYKGRVIRTLTKDGEMWTVLNDVCDAIGIGNSRDVAAHLSDDEKDSVVTNDTNKGSQNITIVNEKGVNAVISRSRKPEAKEFGRWFTDGKGGQVAPQTDGLLTFFNSSFGEIRVSIINGEPHAIGIDIARVLDYADPKRAIFAHCKDIVRWRMSSNKGFRETNMIPESDIYRLIFNAADQSRNPEIQMKAKNLQDWIFKEVLPQIRRTGSYIPQYKKLIEENKQLLLENRQLAEGKEVLASINSYLQLEAVENKPKVDFANAIMATDDLILLGDLSKIAASNGIRIGQNRTYALLRKKKLLTETRGANWNAPTQKAMDLGLFKVCERAVTTIGGFKRISKTTYATPKGQDYILRKLLSGEWKLSEDWD